MRVPANQLKYIPSFDGVRCIAVFFVLALHGSYGYFEGGWIGVDLFFVLSGYLITSLLVKEYSNYGKIHLLKFWLRRALRLIPALLCVILFVNIFWNYFPKSVQADRILATVSGLFYFTNFIKAELLGPLSHLWSLSVEEHFYICWPLLLSFAFLKDSKKRGMWLLVALIILVVAFRIYGYYQFAGGGLTYHIFELDPYRATIFRTDAILCGCFLGLFFRYKEINKTFSVLINCIVCIFLLFALLFIDQFSQWLRFGGFVVTDALCLLTVYLALVQPHHFFLSNRILRYFGRRSYGIYLYHFPIFLLLENFRINHNIPNLIIVTGLRLLLTVIVAEISFRYIEIPILNLKKRLDFKIIN